MDPREIYRKNIYKYCRENMGKEVLFTRFTSLWKIQKKDSDERDDMTPKDLASLTYNIVQELSKKKILKEVKKPEGLDFSPYGFYKIFSN